MGAPTPAAPQGYSTSEEKTWALIAHFGGIIVGFIAPLVALLVKGGDSPTVRAHAVEALNFQITWNAIAILAQVIAVCSAFMTFGALFFLPLVAWAVIVVFSVIAGLRANEGQLYTYPMTLRLVK
jgi:uncharacterized Tic20 family protein